MSSVIIDNWGLSNSLYNRFPNDAEIEYYCLRGYTQIYDEKEYSDLCWQNFLTSIILWDDIHFNIDLMAMSTSLNIRRERLLFNILSKYVDKNNNFFHSIESIEHFKVEHEQMERIYNLNHIYTENYHSRSNLLSRGFDYVLYANALGYNYLPHPERAAMLKNSDIFTRKFDPKIYLNTLDKEIKEYFDKVNDLCDNQFKTVPFPALYNFISKNAKDSEEELALAIELRENKYVKKFRESIDLIENDLENGNILELDASIKTVKEICNEITSRIYLKPFNVGVSLGLSPSINFSFGINRKPVSKLHTTFLYDLADFAIEGKMRRNYKL